MKGSIANTNSPDPGLMLQLYIENLVMEHTGFLIGLFGSVPPRHIISYQGDAMTSSMPTVYIINSSR